MSKRMALEVPNQLPVTPAQKFWVRFKKNWQLHLMVLAPLLYLLLFSYGPLYGLQIAFKTYSPKAGIPASPWVGLANLTQFFGYRKWLQLVWNIFSNTHHNAFTNFYFFCNNGFINDGTFSNGSTLHNDRVSDNRAFFNGNP